MYFGKDGKAKALDQMKAMFANGYHESSLKKYDDMISVVMEELDHDRIGVNEMELDPDVGFFLCSRKNKKKLDEFKNALNAELDKVKNKCDELSDVHLEFSDGYLPDENGDYVLAFTDSDIDEYAININMSPFVNALNNGAKVKDAIKTYIRTPNGEHIIQHEFAHILDVMRNGFKDVSNEHDEEFISIQKELDKIPPKLDL